MKILIVYASAGAGHFKAAEAVCDYFKQKCPEAKVEIADILDKANFLFRLNYSWGYSHLVTQAPLLWKFAFFLTNNKALRFLTNPLAVFINRLNTRNFVNDLIRENPDYIISTHFLPSEISAYLKKRHKITSRLITVITDFKVHPFWIASNTDLYVVASGFTKSLLVSEGIKEENIKEFGIPIHLKFLKEFDRKMLSRELGIIADKFTVLIITGSYGIGPIEEIVSLLREEVQILVVCARNKKLYEKLSGEKYPQVKAYGFVDNIQELMAVSDMIITKPGGLSISELLAMELVPVFISPIPGQESANIEVLESYGVGVFAKDAPQIRRIVLDYKDNAAKLNSDKEKIRKIKKPHAVEELYNALREDSPGFGG